MAFMGETAVVGLAELLSVLATRRHTGRLTIISDGEEAQIYLDDGKVILVSSSNHALRLGRILLRLGILDDAQLDDALRLQDAQGGRRPLGRILLDAGVVTDADLARAAEEQCVEALTRVMVSKEGSFMFNRDARPRATQGLVALNTSGIVLEASRRADEMVLLGSLLPAASSLLALAGPEPADGLTPFERQVVDGLSAGGRTLDELAQHVSMNEVSLWRTVISLRERGIILVHATGSAAEERVAPVEQVEERTVDEVIRLSAEGAGGAGSRVPSLAEIRDGTPAGSPTTAAVTMVIREVIASFNAGLTLRAFAHFSDDYFRRRGAFSDKEIAELRAPGRPRPVEQQEAFLEVSDTCLLQDGRVSATLATHVPTVGETTKLLVLVRQSDRWQIDAVLEAPGAAATIGAFQVAGAAG